MRAEMLSYFKKTYHQLKISFLRLIEDPARLYICLALPVVLIFVFITPPFQGPDEEAHYVRAQYIAHGIILPLQNNVGLPVSIENVAKKVFYDNDIRGKTSTTYDIALIKRGLHIPLNEQEKYMPAMISYSPVSYIPAIPGIVFTNLLNLSPLVSLYASRILLGLVSVLLFYFAIKLLPNKKYLLAAIGLIPMVLFQQAVVTADSISYALLALFVAYILYLRKQANITSKQWIRVALLSVAITFAKPLVFLFLPLLFVLILKPKALRNIVLVGSICVALLGSWMVLNSINAKAGPTPGGIPQNVDSEQQAAQLLNNPKRGLRVLWNSYMTPFGDDETRGIIGVFGAADTVYPLWMFTLYAGILFFLFTTTFNKRDKKDQILIHWKLLAIILAILYFLIVNFVIYLGYSPVNFDIFYGVQGRYFIPILIVFATFVLTGGVYIAKNEQQKTKAYTVLGITLLLLLALFITFQRYYLYTP